MLQVSSTSGSQAGTYKRSGQGWVEYSWTVNFSEGDDEADDEDEEGENHCASRRHDSSRMSVLGTRDSPCSRYQRFHELGQHRQQLQEQLPKQLGCQQAKAAAGSRGCRSPKVRGGGSAAEAGRHGGRAGAEEEGRCFERRRRAEVHRRL